VSAIAPTVRRVIPQRVPFGHAPDGTAVDLFTFANARGIELGVMTYGGIIVSLRLPDREGRFDDVVLGHDDVDGYVRSASYFGAIIGRCGNRIDGGRFTLDGVSHQLVANDGRNHLHGGARGFDKVVWSAEPFGRDGVCGVTLDYTSADGEQGYPGALTARVTYTLTDHNELIIDYRATADRATPVNLTQHTYWNLAGGSAPDVLDHELTINASHFTPVTGELIPTGAVTAVAGTPFDFRVPIPIGARIDDDDDQLRYAGGYDHNFVLDRAGDGLEPAARLGDPITGRVLDIRTTEPGLQFYSGNFLDGTIRGKSGRFYGHRGGLCLETQHFPDSPNKPQFPSVVLRSGEEYRSRTVFRFSVDEMTTADP
jgi:aldose 1-epimerase